MMRTGSRSWPSLLLALLALLGSSSLLANPIVWKPTRSDGLRSEHIVLSVESSVLSVRGTYVFDTRKSNSSNSVLFPFVRDPSMGKPEFISAAIQCGAGSPKPLKVIRSVHYWWAWHLPEGDKTCSVTLEFKRKLKKKKRVGLLLTAARVWSQAPEQIQVDILLPPNLGDPEFSLPVRLVSQDSTCTRYVLEYERAFPRQNLFVSWDE